MTQDHLVLVSSLGVTGWWEVEDDNHDNRHLRRKQTGPKSCVFYCNVVRKPLVQTRFAPFVLSTHVCTTRVASLCFILGLSVCLSVCAPHSPELRLEAAEAGQWRGGLRCSPFTPLLRRKSVSALPAILLTVPGICCLSSTHDGHQDSNIVSLSRNTTGQVCGTGLYVTLSSDWSCDQSVDHFFLFLCFNTSVLWLLFVSYSRTSSVSMTVTYLVLLRMQCHLDKIWTMRYETAGLQKGIRATKEKTTVLLIGIFKFPFWE